MVLWRTSLTSLDMKGKVEFCNVDEYVCMYEASHVCRFILSRFCSLITAINNVCEQVIVSNVFVVKEWTLNPKVRCGLHLQELITTIFLAEDTCILSVCTSSSCLPCSHSACTWY